MELSKAPIYKENIVFNIGNEKSNKDALTDKIGLPSGKHTKNKNGATDENKDILRDSLITELNDPSIGSAEFEDSSDERNKLLQELDQYSTYKKHDPIDGSVKNLLKPIKIDNNILKRPKDKSQFTDYSVDSQQLAQETDRINDEVNVLLNGDKLEQAKKNIARAKESLSKLKHAAANGVSLDKLINKNSNHESEDENEKKNDKNNDTKSKKNKSNDTDKEPVEDAE